MEPEWRPAWQRYNTPEARRGRTNDAITALEREGSLSACLARLLRHLLDFADEHGATRIGAAKLGEVMSRCRERVLKLEEIACAQGWLQCIRPGGHGIHHTNWFLFKIGVWRDERNDAHAQAHFSDRLKATLARFTEAEASIMCDHLGRDRRCCKQFAPRYLKEPPIEWVS